MPPPAAGQGALSVTVAVFGPRPGPDGYVVQLGDEDEETGPRGDVPPEGGTVTFRELARDTYSVAVTPGPEACPLDDDGRRSVVVEGGGEVAGTEFLASCTDAEVAVAYERTSPGRYDRFYLDEDGSFLVDDGPPSGSQGTYGLSDGVYVFRFDYTSSWGEDGQATGRLDGDCMSVSYGVVLFVDGYEDGRYCRLPEP